MLSSIRTAATNWLGRLVLGIIMSVLALSFAIWGIGDMFRGRGVTTVATVGSVEIGVETFRRLFTDELQRLSQRVRQPITLEQARLFGLDRQLLGRLIADAALDAKARDLGLSLAPDAVARIALADPSFQGANGAFDRARFDQILRASGMNEAMFLSEQRRFLVRRELGLALGGTGPAPAILAEAFDRYQKEKRDIAFFRIPGQSVEAGVTVDEAALKAFHDERKATFRTPETRKATILAINAQTFAQAVSVSEVEIRALYDKAAATGRFGPPEKRRAAQILYDTEEEAKAARARISDDVTFDTLREDRKISAADADLGSKTRGEIGDEAVAAAMFELAEGGISAPVKTAFGFALLKLIEITPAAILPFEALRATLEPEAKAAKAGSDPKAREQEAAAFKAVEEARLAGKALAEIGVELKLPVRVFDALDQANPPRDVPGGAETLRAVFGSDIGLDNAALTQPDGGHVWFEVNAVEPAREKTFEEARAEVETAWRAETLRKLLADKAAALLEQVKSGTTLEAAAESIGARVETANDLGWTGAASIGGPARDAAFAIKPGEFASAASEDGGSRLVLKVTAARVPAFDAAAADAKQLADRLGEQWAEDIVNQYVTRLRAELGVTVNDRALALATGAAGP